MRRSIYLLVLLVGPVGCADQASPTAGRARVERLDTWIVARQADSINAAVSDRATAIRPNAGLLAGEAAKRVIAWDSTAVQGRSPSEVHEFATSIVETGEIRRAAGAPFLFTRVWAVEASEWRLTLDAVVDPGAGPVAAATAAEQPGEALLDGGEPPAPPSGIVDSVSVGEIVTAAVSGDRSMRERIRQAADGCGAGSESWQRQVVQEIISRPPESIGGSALAMIVPPMSIATFRCEDLGVDAWFRSALYVDLSEWDYRMMVGGLADGFGYRILGDLTGDEEAAPSHRLWATESLVGSRSTRSQTVGPGGLTDRLAEHYQFNGVPPIYVDTWVPMLLAAPQTRETAAQDLIRAVARTPDRMGAADILFTVAANVEAYAYRFSAETRSIVADALQELGSRQSELPSAVASALDAAREARASRRNHAGVQVERTPLQLELAATGQACAIVGPAALVESVNSTAPGFQLQPARDCQLGTIAYGDFDGDGSDDALIKGVTEGQSVLLAVLGGRSPSAHVVSSAGSNDWGYIHPPGTFMPACDGTRSIYANDWIVVSYDEKYSATFRFDGSVFERLMGDEC